MNKDISLSVQMPDLPGSRERLYIWRLISEFLRIKADFQVTSDIGDYDIVTMGINGLALKVSRSPVNFKSADIGELSVTIGESLAKILMIQSSKTDLHGDFIAPLIFLTDLQEENEVLKRDTCGRVLAVNSPRYKANTLMNPYLEYAAIYVADKLGFSDTRKKNLGTWGVGISCDVDEVEDEHISLVLDVFNIYGVINPTFFIYARAGERVSPKDPTYDLSDESVSRRLHPLLESDSEIGIHLSYSAYDNLEMMLAEKDRLEKWSGRKTEGCRTHYLRFAYPRTWMRMEQCGFKYDSSLGYYDKPGFRSGICSPYVFSGSYCADKPFHIVPLAFMDQMFFYPAKWASRDTRELLTSTLSMVKETRSFLTVDWHSYAIAGGNYSGWWDILLLLMEQVNMMGGELCGIKRAINRVNSLSVG